MTGTFCKIPTIEETCELLDRATKEATTIEEWLAIVDAGDPWVAAAREHAETLRHFERYYAEHRVELDHMENKR